MRDRWRMTAMAVVLVVTGWLAVAGPAEAGVSSLGIGSGTVSPGGTITIALSATTTSPGIGAYTVDVVYDSSLVEATGCTAPGGACSVDAIAPDTVRFAGALATGSSGELTLGSITFVAGPSEGTASLIVSIIKLTDPSPFNIFVAPTHGSISIAALIVGDVDCDGDVDSVDGLKILQHVAGKVVNQSEPCPDIGSQFVTLFGDVDCDGDVDSVDALKVMRFVALLPVSQIEPCTNIGSTV